MVFYRIFLNYNYIIVRKFNLNGDKNNVENPHNYWKNLRCRIRSFSIKGCEQPIRYFEYQPGRSGKYPQDFLEGFRGYIHTDACKGYNGLPDVTRCLCWAHVRRAFADALPVDVKDSEATKQGLMNYLLDGSCAFSADPERFPRTAIPVISRISGRVPAVGSDHTENVSIGAPIFKRLVFFFCIHQMV